MQSLQNAIECPPKADGCARELVDTVPMMMRVIRMYMRGHRSGLTVPQFRTLCYIDSTEGSSLSGVADFIGLSLPAMSRLVDGLVDKRLMKRKAGNDDRRQVCLSVTNSGQTAIREARELAQDRLARVVGQLTVQQQDALTDSMKMMRNLITLELLAQDDNG